MSRLEPRVTVKEVIKDFPTMLSIDGSTNIGCVIVSEVGKKLAYVAGPNQFLANYTKDGQTIPRNAHISFINAYYLSFVAGLVIARSMNSDVVGGVRVYKQSNALSTVPTYFNSESELSKYAGWGSIAFDGESVQDYAIVFDETIYFMTTREATTEAPDPIAAAISAIRTAMVSDHPNIDTYATVNLGTFGTTINDFVEQLASELNIKGDYITVNNSGSLTLNYDEFTAEPVIDTTKDLHNITMTYTAGVDRFADQSSKTLLFTIMSRTAGNKNDNPYKILVSATSGTSNLFKLTLDSEEYTVSLNPEATDASGVNAYIDALNNYTDINFSVKVAENLTSADWSWTTGITSAVSFGAGFVDSELCKKPSCMTAAWSTIEDQETYKIHGLSPMGITNVQFIKTMITVGARHKWFTPWDIPYDRVTKSAIVSYCSSMPDDYNNYVLGPFDKNSGLTGWINYIAATTLYWERVMRNKSVGSEFAPVFDETTGLLAYNAPTKLLTKSVREDLLSVASPINYVIYNENNMSYYANDNRTHYNSEDIMNEECNVRMAHKISNDLQDLMKQFKAKYNNEQTRQNVNDLINLYFQDNIMNQNFKPEEFMVICNETNNTDKVIRAGKLAVTVKIRLYHSIKEIEVLNELYSVGKLILPRN